MNALSPAEELLQSLGVETPEEIDLQAIACHMGVLAIRERKLDGCEARIIGIGRNAIISVNRDAIRQRRRFSVCHELGHWHLHRGEVLYCKAIDIGDRDVSQTKEKEANRFAADLLLPPYLVRPMAASYRTITAKAVDEVRQAFRASRSATAIQLVKLHPQPALLAFTARSQRRWQIAGPQIPLSLSTRGDIGQESWAFTMLYGSAPDQPQPRMVRADVWFDRRGAERFRVSEQSFAVAEDTVATLITFPDPKMLEVYADSWR